MNILITGSSRGIGYSIAELLLKHGARVIGTSRSDKAPFDHPDYSHICCDMNREEDLKKLKQLFSENNHPIPEVVVNNAGMFRESPIDESESDWLDTWDITLQVNLRAPALICKWAVEAWRRESIRGRVINISSRAGYRGDTQEYAAYAASKGGLVAFTKSLARSLGKDGITAYTIAPGFVNTDMAQGSIEVYGEEYLTQGLALDTIAPPEEVANMVLPLAEGKLEHMTGQTFHINSGSYLI